VAKTIAHKRWRNLAILLITVSALMLAVRPVLRSEWMRGLVLEKLRTVVSKAAGPAYSLQIGKVEIDPIGGDLAIMDIVLGHDSAVVDSLLIGRGRFLLSGRAGRIAITGLSYWRLLLANEVRLGSATVYTPVLRYTYASHRAIDTVRTAVTREVGDAPELISLGELVITEASGTAVDLAARAPELVVDRFDMRAEDIRVVLPDMGSVAQWVVGSAQVDIQHVLAQLPPLYDLTIAHIGLLHPEGLASIDSLRFIPRVDRKTTHKFLHEMTSIYALDVKSISLARIDLYRAFAEQQVEMGSLTVDGAFMDIFLDKTMPDEADHFKPLPVSALRNVPFGLRVDTLRLTHAEMLYSERFDAERGYGDTRLTGIEATILNVSNDTLLALADTVMRGTVDAKLFDKGILHGEYRAPLASHNDAFELDVTLRDMPLAAANSMSENLILLRADSGWINSLHFQMNANNDSVTGPFTLKYSNAWLRIVDGDGKKRGFLTTLVNSTVNHDSKDKPVAERTERLRMARRKDRSLFNFIWIYTREGLMHTLLPEALADVQSGMMKRKASGKKGKGIFGKSANRKKDR
jgi:hypothetical protein